MRYTRNKISQVPLVFNLEIFLVVLFLITPMIIFLNQLLRGVFFTWPLFFIWFSYSVKKNNNFDKFRKVLILRQSAFISIGAFVVIVFFYYAFVTTTDKALQYFTVFFNFILVLIIDSYYSIRSEKYRLSILFFIILLLGIQAAYSIPYLLNTNSYIIRLFSSGQLDSLQTLDAIKHGVGNNGLYSSIGAIAILGFSIMNRFSLLIRIILICSIIALIFSIIVSTLLAPVFLLSVGILIIAIKYGKKVFNLKIALYTVAIITILFVFYLNVLSKTDLMRPIQAKIEAFDSNKQDVTGRRALADVSINTIMDHPFFGIGVPEWHSYDVIGEHMPWVDYFANFGFLGVVPLFVFLLVLFRDSYSFYFKKDKFKLYRTACFIGVIIFVLSNFISPMITVSNMYTLLIMYYMSYSNKINSITG